MVHARLTYGVGGAGKLTWRLATRWELGAEIKQTTAPRSLAPDR